MFRWVKYAQELTAQKKREKTGPNVYDSFESQISSDHMESKKIDQQVLKLHILKERGRGLGIQISSSAGEKKGIFVSHLLDEGAAARDGRIRTGDELLFVNGYSLIGTSLQDAIQLLRSAKNPIQIIATREVEEGTDEHFDENNNNSNCSTELPFEDDNLDDGGVKEVVLINGKNGKRLGFSIVGGADTNAGIFIKNIFRDGLSAADGRLKVGDEILKLNGVSLSGVRHEDAVYLFKSLGKGPVRLVLKNSKSALKRKPSWKDHPNVHKVILNKAFGKGLGIGVVALGSLGKKNYGIYVKYIAKGSAVSKDSDLRLKDQILYINDISLRNKSLEDTYQILRSLQVGKVKLIVKRTKKHEDLQKYDDGTGYDRMHDESFTKGKVGTEDSFAVLMSPAMPVHKTSTARKESFPSAVSLCDSPDSDDDDNSLSLASTHCKSDVKEKHTKNAHDVSSQSWLDDDDIIESSNQKLSIDELADPENMVVSLIKSHGDNYIKGDIIDSVVIQRDPSGSLGLNIRIKKGLLVGSHGGVFAKSVVPNGSADQATGSDRGGIKNGDEILQVNDKVLDNLSHNAVIALFKNIPRKSVFVLKRKDRLEEQNVEDLSQQTKVKERKRIITDHESKNGVMGVPNLIEDQVTSIRTPLIQRNSILTEKIGEKTKQRHTDRGQGDEAYQSAKHSFPVTNAVEKDQSLTSPLNTMLTLDKASRSSIFKVLGKNACHDISLPDPSEIPESYNVHFIEIVKGKKETLGLSLVAASGDCDGFYQIRRILPGGICETNKQIVNGDCIYSVNGINIKGMSHPQALQVLKQCHTSAKLILLREKSKDEELLQQAQYSSTLKLQKKTNSHATKSPTLPGIMLSDGTPESKRPPFQRRVTTASEVSSNPITKCREENADENVEKYCNSKNGATLNLKVTGPDARNLSDNESEYSNGGSPKMLPRIIAMNRRSSIGPFMIEYEKIFKGLGVDVFIDSNGECCISNISPNGLLGADNRIRVGDTLLAVNGELLTTKPISSINNIIRSIPRGRVNVIVKPSETDNIESLLMKNKTFVVPMDDQESMASTSTYQPSSTWMSSLSVPLPEDKKTTVLSHNSSFGYLPPPASFNPIADISTSITPAGQDRLVARTRKLSEVSGSDFTALPPPPSRPVVRKKNVSHDIEIEYHSDAESDVESMFSCVPAAPPPVILSKHVTDNMKSKLAVINQQFRQDILDSLEKKNATNVESSVFVDDGKSDFYIPPPPPPVRKQRRASFHKDYSSDENKETLDRTSNTNNKMETFQNDFKTYEEIDNFEFDHSGMVKKPSDSEVLCEKPQKNVSEQHTTGDEIEQKETKKKSLFAKLKSRILLPSKSSINQHATIKNKKEKRKRRPSSTSDEPQSYNGTLTRSKFSSSQPDLTFNPFDVYVAPPPSNLKKSGSVDTLLCHQNEFLNEIQVIRTSTLPKILSFKKPEKEKKRRRRKSSQQSPPSSPPPPPPSTFNGKNDINEIELSEKGYPVSISSQEYNSLNRIMSPYEVIDTPRSQDEPSSYEVIDPDPLYPDQRFSLSDSSSGFNSYAAEGPTAVKHCDDTGEHGPDSFDSIRFGAHNTKKEPCESVRNTHPEVNIKPPPPPPKPHITRDISKSMCDIPSQGTIDDGGRTGLKKRGSSLLALNIPPPPAHDVGDESSDNKSTPASSEDASSCSGSSRPSPASSHTAMSALSEKDKSDPKLQPFIMTEDVGELLRSLPFKNFPDHSSKPELKIEEQSGQSSTFDDDDWGSEFSASVYEAGSRLNSSASNYGNYASSVTNKKHDALLDSKQKMKFQTLPADPVVGKEKKSNALEISTKSNAKELRPFLSKESVNKAKVKSNDEKVSSKDRKKRGKSTPSALFEQSAFEISEPVLLNRKSFSEIFSKEQLAAYGFPKDVRSHDALIQNVIQRNKKNRVSLSAHKRSRSESNVSSFSMASGAYAVPDHYKQQETSRSQERGHYEMTHPKKNPVPKPPRRGTLDSSFLLSADSYANHEQIKTKFDSPHRAQKKGENEIDDDEAYENLKLYQHLRHGDESRRPLPDIPYHEELRTNNTSLSQEELETLYAQVDFSKKSECKQEDLYENLSVIKRNLQDSRDGYSSDGTVYTTPDKDNFKDEYTSNNFTSTANDFIEGDFRVQLLRQSGEPFGVTITGGADTPITKVLIKSILPGSIADKCSVPLKVGDEILVVNNANLIGFSHSDVLNVLQKSPPLVHMTLRRSLSGNKSLLKHNDEENILAANSMNSEQFFKQIQKSSLLTPNEVEVVTIQNPNNKRRSMRLNTSSFDSSEIGSRLNQVLHTPPLLKRSDSKGSTNTRKRSSTTRSENTNVSISDISDEPGDNLIQVDLHKQEGRGLGIAVYGGPKHVVTEGIKVKKLVPGSLAYLDGRLCPGDVLKAINGTSLQGYTQAEALAMLKDTPKVILLTVYRSKSDSTFHETSNTQLECCTTPLPSGSATNCSRRGSMTSNKSILGSRKVVVPSDQIASRRSSVISLTQAAPTSSGTSTGRSRSVTRAEKVNQRSRSETREEKDEKEEKKRPRSLSRLSRIFRSSKESVNDVKDTPRMKQPITGRNSRTSRRDSLKSIGMFSIAFDKSSSSFDFMLTGGRDTIYGDSPLVVEAVRKGSELHKTLCAGDQIIDIKGHSTQHLSKSEAWELLHRLPHGRVTMVVARK